MIDWKAIHDCPQSEGRIVSIAIDNLGITLCAYCQKPVDYWRHFPNKKLCKLSAPSVIFGGAYRCEVCGKLHEKGVH